MSQHRLHPALIAVLLVVTPGAAHAQKAPRVGVVVSVKVNLTDDDAIEISDALGRALRKHLVVDVIAGAEAARRLPPDGVAGVCMVERDCVADVAQRLSADELLFLVANKIGSRYQIDATWIDVASMRTVSRPAVSFDRVAAAEVAFAGSAAFFLPDASERTIATTQAPDVRTRHEPRSMTPAAWIAAGVGGAALIGAVAFTLASRNDYDDLDRGCGAIGTCDEDKLERLERKALAADVLWGVAAAGAITTGVLWWLSGGEVVREEASVRVGPAPGGAVGLSLEGIL